MDVKEFLIKMSNMTGVSGYETERAGIIAEGFSEYCDDVSIDKFGNVIGLKKGKGKGKIMAAAHMDEIGLMVADIDENGFIKVTTLGGFDQRTLPAQEVIVHGREKLFGIIGMSPPHITAPEEAKKAIKLEDLAIDIGLPAEKVRELVSIGDLITINRQVLELQNDKLSGKCFDDTAGIAGLVYALQFLRDVSTDADFYVVASTQEEVGCRGAATAAYTVNPDIAIAVDVGFARTSELKEEESIEMGKGPDVACGPNISRRVFERLKETARDNHTPVQFSVSPRDSGTDAWAMQTVRNGVATAVVSIPLKYMHTSVETISMKDLKATGKLLADFVRSYNNCDMEESLCL